jgi:hypothetical protein
MWRKQWLESGRSKIRMRSWHGSRKYGWSPRLFLATSWSSLMLPDSFTCLSKCQLRKIMAAVHVKKMESDRKMTSWAQLNPWEVPWSRDVKARHRTESPIRARTLLIWNNWCKTSSASLTRLTQLCSKTTSMSLKMRYLMRSNQSNRVRCQRVTRDTYSS